MFGAIFYLLFVVYTIVILVHNVLAPELVFPVLASSLYDGNTIYFVQAYSVGLR